MLFPFASSVIALVEAIAAEHPLLMNLISSMTSLSTRIETTMKSPQPGSPHLPIPFAPSTNPELRGFIKWSKKDAFTISTAIKPLAHYMRCREPIKQHQSVLI